MQSLRPELKSDLDSELYIHMFQISTLFQERRNPNFMIIFAGILEQQSDLFQMLLCQMDCMDQFLAF